MRNALIGFLCIFFPSTLVAEVEWIDPPKALLDAMLAQEDGLYDLYAEERNQPIDPTFSFFKPKIEQDIIVSRVNQAPHCEDRIDVWVKNKSGEYTFREGFVSCGESEIIVDDGVFALKNFSINPVIDFTIYTWNGGSFDKDVTIKIPEEAKPLEELVGATLFDILSDKGIQEHLLSEMSFSDLVELGYRTGTEYPAIIEGDYLIGYGCVRNRLCHLYAGMVMVNLQDSSVSALLVAPYNQETWGNGDGEILTKETLQHLTSTNRLPD